MDTSVVEVQTETHGGAGAGEGQRVRKGGEVVRQRGARLIGERRTFFILPRLSPGPHVVDVRLIASDSASAKWAAGGVVERGGQSTGVRLVSRARMALRANRTAERVAGRRIVSPGCSGSTALSAASAISASTGWNTHDRHPRRVRWVTEGGRGEGEGAREERAKVVYVFADPYNVLLCILRRGLRFMLLHCENVGCHLRNLLASVRACGGGQRPSVPCMLAHATDWFRLEHHFRAWWEHADRPYDILFARYEALPENLQLIADFLGSRDIESFKFKCRASRWQQLSVGEQRGLNTSLGPFRSFLEALPDVAVFAPRQRCIPPPPPPPVDFVVEE